MIEFFYKINISKSDFEDFEDLTEKYDELIKNDKEKIKEKIDSFEIMDEEDGNKIQANWFPKINADVFISHSHDDEELAKALGGYIISEKTNLKPFIDSEVWGYSNELLKSIDNNYCKFENSDLYSYKLRNHSTSHVHMMLSVALMQMISKCRYFIFLDTPNSNENNNTLIKDNDINKTNSPWIYNELMVTKIIYDTIENTRKNIYVKENLEYFSKKIPISYKANTEHLKEIDLKSLIKKLKTGGNNNV